MGEMSEQKKEVWSIVGLIAIALTVGFIVAFITGLMGLPAMKLPGGSLGAGLMNGAYYPVKRLPLWYRLVTGAIAGLLGWSLALIVLALMR